MGLRFRRERKRSEDDVIVDRLTGAFNRRQLDKDIAAGLDTSGQPTATLMIEVDDIGTYDGRKGRATSDQVLERVAWTIMATVRTTDVVYRHDASTFCVLLPSTTDHDAVSVAERVRGNVEKMPLLSDSGVTVTVGVASGLSTGVAESVDRALEALDEALRTGQSQVVNGGAAPAPEPLRPPAPVIPIHEAQDVPEQESPAAPVPPPPSMPAPVSDAVLEPLPAETPLVSPTELLPPTPGGGSPLPPPPPGA